MARAEANAAEVLELCGVTEAPVPVEQVASRLGISIAREPFKGDISGVLYREGANVVIGVNSSQAPVRQRFTIAHEIGHFRLHPGHDVHVDRDVKVDFRDDVSSLAVHKGEIEANAFAAELLMPRRLVQQAVVSAATRGSVTKRSLIEELAERFDVSRQAMEFRLVNLGVIHLPT
jgi:Zn-dependent peptidase ImmA (M78 family)